MTGRPSRRIRRALPALALLQHVYALTRPVKMSTSVQSEQFALVVGVYGRQPRQNPFSVLLPDSRSSARDQNRRGAKSFKSRRHVCHS